MILRNLYESVDNKSSMLPRAMLLFFIGFFMIFLGIIVLMAAVLLSGGSADFGAVIFIGPFPIVVGVGPRAEWLVLLAIILGVLSIVMMFLLFRGKVGRAKDQS